MKIVGIILFSSFCKPNNKKNKRQGFAWHLVMGSRDGAALFCKKNGGGDGYSKILLIFAAYCCQELAKIRF